MSTLNKINSFFSSSSALKRFLLAFIVISAVHLPYVANGFIWLDHNDIEQGFARLPVKNLLTAFTTPFGQTSFYRPVVTLLNSTDYFFYGTRATGYHVTNLILFGFWLFVSIRFITCFFPTKVPLFTLLLILGLHPLTIFVTGFINLRQELLLSTFTLLTFIFIYKNSLLGAFFWLLAVFTKETAVVLIPALFIYFKFYRYRKFLWSGIFITLTYLIIRSVIVPDIWGTNYPDLSKAAQITTRLTLFGKALFHSLSPLKPNFSDALPVYSYSSNPVWLTLFTFLLLISTKYFPVYFLFLLPGLNIVPLPRPGSPHYAFLALPALIGYLFSKKAFSRRFAKYIVWIWIIIAGTVAFISGFQFQTDQTFFDIETKKDPNFVEGYYHLGNYYLKSADFTKAVINLEQANTYRQNYLYFYPETDIKFNLAAAYLETNQLDKAGYLYDQLLTQTNSDLRPYLYFNIALIAYRQGNFQKTIDILEQNPSPLNQANALLNEAKRLQNL